MTHFVPKRLRGCMWATVAVFVVLTYAQDAWSRSPKRSHCEVMTDDLANTLFDNWNKALQISADEVVKTYAPNAVLLPTIENGPLIGPVAIRGYFAKFLEEHPFGTINDRHIVPAGCNMGIVAGLYTFLLTEHGGRVKKRARYTFVYIYRGGRWLIDHHHSSAQPK